MSKKHKHRKGHKHRHHRSGTHFDMLERHPSEFRRYGKMLRWLPVGLTSFLLLIAFLTSVFIGQNNFMVVVGALFAILIIGVILQTLFFRMLISKLINPLLNLKQSIEEIAEGNYSVRISEPMIRRGPHRGDMRQLLKTFNMMAEELEANEKLKQTYEENRKLLVANISHDLKTPMTTINGYLEILEEGLVTDQAQIDKYVKIMKNNTNYMNRLVDDLFLYSKLDIDQINYNFEDYNAKSYFEDMFEEYQLIFKDKDMQLTYNNIIEQDTFFSSDNKMLSRAFKNIMDNAIKYANTIDDVRVEVDLASSNGYITLKIRDYGPGISDDKLPMIFNRFYRVDDERTKHIESTGLGLAISKELIEAHGGRITAGSHHQGGAVFIIQLPAIKEIS